MLERIRELFEGGESFAFETTLATRGYVRQIARWQAAGYHVKLYFLRLPDEGFAVRRVENRVRKGGHAIPPDVVRRRFVRGLENLRERYLGVVDEWSIYDTSESPVRLVETGGKARPPRIMDDPGSHSSSDEPTRRVEPLDDPDFIGAEAALARASTKAIAMTRAAGLEPEFSNGGDDVDPAER